MKKSKKRSTEPLDIPQMPLDDALRIALSTPPLRKMKKKRSKYTARKRYTPEQIAAAFGRT